MSSSGQQFDHLFKIVLVGDSGVGKSNLLSRFTRDAFTTDEKSTIGVEFATRIVTMSDGKRIKAQIWDTAGQERYRAITTAYYRGALGAMLIFDVTKSSSFENIPRWLRELKDHANRDIVLSMIGNKIDLTDADQGGNPLTRQVNEESERAMAAELQLPVIESSAKTGAGVDRAFVALIERIYAQAQLNKQNSTSGGSISNNNNATQSPSVQLNQNTETKESKCC